MILLVAFGALIAAGLPLLLALTAVLATIGPARDPEPPDADRQGQSASIVMLIGLAVGVDYSMFYLRREREERRAGKSRASRDRGRRGDLGACGARLRADRDRRDGGHVLHRDKTFESFGLATMTVVAVAVLGSLTVLPALLVVARRPRRRGRASRRLRLRRRGRREPLLERDPRPGARAIRSWRRLAAAHCSRSPPRRSDAHGEPRARTIPKSIPVMKVYDQIAGGVPGRGAPCRRDGQGRLAASAARCSARSRASASGRRSGRVPRADAVDVNTQGTIAASTLPIVGGGTDSASNHALLVLRERDRAGDGRPARGRGRRRGGRRRPTRTTSTSR